MEMFSKKSLKKLIIPLVIEQILAVAVGMADTIMVSSVGEAAVSGVSLVLRPSTSARTTGSAPAVPPTSCCL